MKDHTFKFYSLLKFTNWNTFIKDYDIKGNLDSCRVLLLEIFIEAKSG